MRSVLNVIAKEWTLDKKRIQMENQNKLYHFVGIKGSGMSSLALVYMNKV